jgi:hypothetical protein
MRLPCTRSPCRGSWPPWTPDGGDEMAAWRDQRFHDAWVGIIGQRRNPLTAQTPYTCTAAEHADPDVLDFDNARGVLQSCGTHFMEAVLEPAGVAPLVGALSNVGSAMAPDRPAPHQIAL